MNTHYPVHLDTEDDGITVTFPGLPWGVTSGATVDEALVNAEDCLVVIVTSLINDGEVVPEPVAGDFKHFVALPEDIALKLAFYRAFKESGISKAELGRRLEWRTQQVARLFDATHHTRVDHLFRAIRALGKRVAISLEPAA